MEALILDTKYETLAVIDSFESFIWVDRYREPGDFEIYMPVERAPLEYIKRDNYVWIKDSDRLMVIEDVSISSDLEMGPHITFSGRSLESILDRRVIFYRTIINGSLQDGIERLLNENIISPIYSERQIPNLRFIRSSDPKITSITMNASYLGENLLDVIEGLLELHDLGFKIIYNEANGTLDMSLFYGEDRSYAQEKNPWVVFSPDFDNLLGSNYYESYANLKTAGIVAGSETDEKGQEIVDVNGIPTLKGMQRREAFIDGSSIERPEVVVDEEGIRERMEEYGKKNDYTQETIDRLTQQEIDKAVAQQEAKNRPIYLAQLRELGLETLKTTYITESFEGEIEAVRQYVFGVDFFIGDVVQVRDQFGKEASSRITEVLRSHDVNGESLTPTFTTLIGGANKGDIPYPS